MNFEDIILDGMFLTAITFILSPIIIGLIYGFLVNNEFFVWLGAIVIVYGFICIYCTLFFQKTEKKIKKAKR